MFRSMTAVMTYSGFARDVIQERYGTEPWRLAVVGSALKMPEDHIIDWSGRGPSVVFVTTDFERKGGYELISIFSRVGGARRDAYNSRQRAARRERVEEAVAETHRSLGRSELTEVYLRSSLRYTRQSTTLSRP